MFNLQRLLVNKIEHRILVSTVAFLAILAIIGWIAINEGGRMVSFENQFKARSIERGAALFATNCSTCHGVDGLGLAGRAPALNSPYMFGHDYLASIDGELAQLNVESALEATTDERRAEIETRVNELNSERNTLLSQITTGVANIPGDYDPEQPSRLSSLGWGSSLYNFINTTMVHGRPTSSSYWISGEGMPYWAQSAGGPLRNDQLGDLTNFILNWDKGANWTTEDLFAVNQFPIVPGAGAAVVEDSVGTDVEAIVAELANYQGDPQAGMTLYTMNACAGCHMSAAVAPVLEGTWTRIQNERLADPQFAGYTAEQYAVESIVNPGAYHAPGYGATMPTNFGTTLSYQDLADLVSYLASQDQ